VEQRCVLGGAKENAQKEEMHKTKVAADEKQQAQKEEAKLKTDAAAKKKKSKEATAQQGAREQVKRSEAEKKAEVKEKVEAERSTVDAQLDGERDRVVQALAKALAASEMQSRFDLASIDRAITSSAARLPRAATSHKWLQTPSTTPGDSLNSSWEAPSETEWNPTIQTASKENSLNESPVVVAEPSTGLAMFFGFASCRYSSTLEDSLGDIPATTVQPQRRKAAWTSI